MSNSNSKQETIHWVEPGELHFDHQNPRLAEFGILSNTSEEEILKTLWESMDVLELVKSMAASGFFAHEALIVAEEDDKKIVIEGNRRLAALKVILDEKTATKNGWNSPDVSDDIKKGLQSIPVIYSSRNESWRFLGFKHVNGAAKWTSFAKAKYIAHVHREYGESLSDIASQIGDGFGTVKKLFRGLMVLEQAEKSAVFKIENRYNTRLAFSHLYTGLGYEGFRDYLGLSDESSESEEPVPKDNLKQLGDVCTWLYGDKSLSQAPAIRSQNPDLRHLNKILKNREAIQALRDSNDIESAFEFTRPSEAIFEESLLRAKRELHKAKSHLVNGYDKSEGLLLTAGNIEELARSIYDEMERIRTPTRNRKRLKD